MSRPLGALGQTEANILNALPGEHKCHPSPLSPPESEPGEEDRPEFQVWALPQPRKRASEAKLPETSKPCRGDLPRVGTREMEAQKGPESFAPHQRRLPLGPALPLLQGALSYEDSLPPLLPQLIPITSRFKTRHVWEVQSSEQMAPKPPRKAQTSPPRRPSELERGPKPGHFPAAAREMVPASAQPGSFPQHLLEGPLIRSPCPGAP